MILNPLAEASGKGYLHYTTNISSLPSVSYKGQNTKKTKPRPAGDGHGSEFYAKTILNKELLFYHPGF